MSEGFTSPSGMGAHVNSAGGLLAGVMANFRPGLFSAMVMKVCFHEWTCFAACANGRRDRQKNPAKRGAKREEREREGGGGRESLPVSATISALAYLGIQPGVGNTAANTLFPQPNPACPILRPCSRE